MKKFLALLLALTMVLSLGTVAFAAKPAPVEGSNHTYKAYQIFSGTQGEGSELGNVVWGNGIDADGFLEELVKLDAYENCKTAADVAAVVAKYSDNSAEAKQFAKVAEKYVTGEGVTVVNGQTALDAGYYLVVDVTAKENVGAGDAYNLSLLQLTKKSTFDINKKSEVPEVEKKVSDDNHGLICENTDADHVHTKDCYNWADANEIALGDTDHFKVESAVPATAVDYDYYYFIVNDTMSKGLTYTDGSLKVFLNGSKTAAVEGTDYSVIVTENADKTTTIQVALINAKAHAGESVVLTYDAVLNNDAVIGTSGNLNEAAVDYSNKPSEKYDGTNDQNHPGFPDKDKNVPTGETPKDKTLTYTTAIKLFKVDQDGNALQGVEFQLKGDALNIVLVSEEKFVEKVGGAYWLLNDGTYTKEAPVENDYMKPAENGATAGYVVDNSYTGADKVVIGDTTYRPYVPADDADMAIFVLVENNVDAYASTTVKYDKVTELVAKNSKENVEIKGVVDENGIVEFKGLMDGSYTLEETVTPAGYNTIKPIEFVISCELPGAVDTGAEKCKWNVESDSEITYNEAANAFELTVVNQKGGTLPETGGIGTTIFYVVGAVLVLAAGILLITKKRMGAEG